MVWLSFHGQAQDFQLPSPNLSVTGLSEFSFKFDLGLTPQYPSLYQYGYPPYFMTLMGSTPTNYSATLSDDMKATTIFLEFGDGTFSMKQEDSHIYQSVNSLIYPLSYKLTGLYDDDPRPPRHRMLIPVTPSQMIFPPAYSKLPVGEKLNMQQILDVGKNVGIFANINSVLARDTMIFVLTYKLDIPLASNSYLKFYFNNIDAFESIVLGTTSLARYSYGSYSMPFVRPYFGENVTIDNALNTNGFKNGLKIENLVADSTEHHIFITMVPVQGLSRENQLDADVSGSSSTKLATNTDPVIITADTRVELYNGNGNLVQADEKNYPISDKSHDPNYIEMYPRCLSTPKKNEKIKVHVHCQNIGLGEAKEVTIKVGLPGGIKTFDIDQSSWKAKADRAVNVTWDCTTNPDSLIVKINMSSPITLDGLKAPLYFTDTKTMADIWFTFHTNPGVPNLLTAAANIYFTNFNNSVNIPVATNVDFVQYSECCNCKSKQQGCGCKGKRGWFWRWLFCKKC
jgi:hypothetical protein